MIESYNIYCVSNVNDSVKNTPSHFKNFLPQNLDLKNKEWEVGIVKFGFQFDSEKIEDLSIVSILTDVVIDSLDGNKYSTLVYDTSLILSEKDKYFNHYVKHVKYYPIRNTFIDSITVDLVDINGKNLPIEEKYSSFVHFHLKSKIFGDNREMKYIRVDSEITDMEQTNTNNNFWVHLKDSMELDENSEVALVNINFPNSIINLTSTLCEKNIEILFKRTNENGERNDERYTIKIPPAYYPSASKLLQVLNSKLDKKIKKLIKFLNKDGKLQIASTHNDYIVCKFPEELKYIFGFHNIDETNIFNIKNNFIRILLAKKSKYITPDPINVMYHYPNVMLCYANFIQHSIVGNSYLPILKIIPCNTLSDDNYISVHFDHLEFIKTNVEYLKDLHFQLRNLNGEFIEFEDNKKIILNCVVKK